MLWEHEVAGSSPVIPTINIVVKVLHMKVKDIIDESWIPIYSTMKKYGLRRAKHSDGTPYFKEIKDVINPYKNVNKNSTPK